MFLFLFLFLPVEPVANIYQLTTLASTLKASDLIGLEYSLGIRIFKTPPGDSNIIVGRAVPV